MCDPPDPPLFCSRIQRAEGTEAHSGRCLLGPDARPQRWVVFKFGLVNTREGPEACPAVQVPPALASLTSTFLRAPLPSPPPASSSPLPRLPEHPNPKPAPTLPLKLQPAPAALAEHFNGTDLKSLARYFSAADVSQEVLRCFMPEPSAYAWDFSGGSRGWDG